MIRTPIMHPLVLAFLACAAFWMVAARVAWIIWKSVT